MTVLLALEQQGTLLAVANRATPGYRAGGGTRGKVTTFSNASRMRLIRKMSRLEPRKISFLTLTYPERFPSPQEAKQHLRALLERFRRRFPHMSAIWRLEFQQRGAPHFHLICFEMPYVGFREIRQWWTEIIVKYVDNHEPRVRIEKINSRRGAMWYVAKYLGKVEQSQAGVSSIFIHDAYLHAGRVWGCFNQSWLPYAPLVYTEILTSNPRAIADVKKVMRRYWSRTNKRRFHGAVVLTDAAQQLNADLIRLMLLYGETEIDIKITP